jgi:hypothetical protein
VNGAHPGSWMESNMSPPAMCSTRKPVGIGAVVEQRAALDVAASVLRQIIGMSVLVRNPLL